MDVVHAAHEQGVAIGRRGPQSWRPRCRPRRRGCQSPAFCRWLWRTAPPGARKGVGAPPAGNGTTRFTGLGQADACATAARAQQAQASTCGGSQHVAALHHVFCCHSLSPCRRYKKEVRPWQASENLFRGPRTDHQWRQGCRCLPTLALCPAPASCGACLCASVVQVIHHQPIRLFQSPLADGSPAQFSRSTRAPLPR